MKRRARKMGMIHPQGETIGLAFAAGASLDAIGPPRHLTDR
jgi:hypothetical protein